jgi:hypothetical protein
VPETTIPKINIPNNWQPRPDQRRAWDYLENGGLRSVVVAHRRYGKDDIALHFTATQTVQRVGNYWHMLPQYNQCRKAIWEAINPATGKRRIDEAFPPAIRTSKRDTDMFIGIKSGSSWQLVGSDNYDSIVGSPPVGIVFSEYALSDPSSYAYLSPILEQNGGWAFFISTSRGNNHLKRLYDMARVTEGWFAQLIRADQTSVFSSEQLEKIRTELIALHGDEYGEALFRQEYFCSFQGAVLGAYYSKQIETARREGRIGVVPYAPELEVETWWDLGIDDSMTVWFVQRAGHQVRVIDYHEASGHGLEYYAKILRDKGYNYSVHKMPHDANVREMGSGDIARSRKDAAEALGIKPIQVVQRARNMDMIVQVHIPAVRNLLARCWFDEKKCSIGLSALEGYSSEYDEEKKILSNKPKHSWHSHGADAFRTGAVEYKDEVGKSKSSDWRKNIRSGSWRA